MYGRFDLLVIGKEVHWASDWPRKVHVICFSEEMSQLPGPAPNSDIVKNGYAETEEFQLPDVPLSFSRRRDADTADLSSVREWARLHHRYQGPTAQRENAQATFDAGAIIRERQTNAILACHFLRWESNLGMAWIPLLTDDPTAWVELLITEWSQIDPDAFPTVGDWTAMPDWMVSEEESLVSEIKAQEQNKIELVGDIDKKIGEISSDLAVLKEEVNRGRRRLITHQGDELVDEVAEVFEQIGFDVTRIDDTVGENVPKREDLRLQERSQIDNGWTAIVEVRGYAKSGGTTADLLRLDRFANMYERETGRPPDKRIYVINGQIQLLPSQRQEPLASATEDIGIFAESDGLIISTLDLFRALKSTTPDGLPTLMQSIKQNKGRWILP